MRTRKVEKRFKPKSNDGFSIVELILSMAIISIVAIFIVIIAAEMLVFTEKTHAKDIALQLADSKIEELRSTLNIPEYAVDEPKPGYIRTVTSTYIKEGTSPTSPVIKYLRNVTVTVRTPPEMGAKTVTIVTNIQTYRPQISFLLPVTAVSYANAKDPVLEGTIRDDAFDIPKSQVLYRTGNGSSWGSWSPVPYFYSDIDRNNPVTSPTLSWGITYYFTIPLLLSGNGTITEIQVEATNTASIANIQPTTPLGGSSYVRLISDNTPPVISPANSPPYRPSKTDTKPGFRVSVGIHDELSGVRNCYLLLSKEDEEIKYWDESDPRTPTWSNSPFYSAMELDPVTPNIYRWPPSGTSTTPTITRDEIFRMTIFALDQTIGKFYDYLNKIPTHGVLPPSNPEEKLWPDVASNFSAFSEILPFIETIGPAWDSSTSGTVYGEVNTHSTTYLVYFLIRDGKEGSIIGSTSKTPIKSNSPQIFAHSFSVSDPGYYSFQAVCETPWGTFWGKTVGLKVEIPNGGESWAIGENEEIQWWALGLEGEANIYVSRDGGSNWEEITPVDINLKSYQWMVSAPGTENALIKIEQPIEGASGLFIRDISDNPFRIYFSSTPTPSPYIRVIDPNGGEEWAIGEDQQIRWEAYGVTGTVKILLSRDGETFAEEIASGVPVVDGSYTWTATGPQTESARIMVQSENNPTLSDISDNPFKISYIVVSSPNGGEIWELGTSQTIKWKAPSLPGTINILLSRDLGETWESIGSGISANTGQFVWTVTGTPTNTALIKIESGTDPSIFDVSDAPFTIY